MLKATKSFMAESDCRGCREGVMDETFGNPQLFFKRKKDKSEYRNFEEDTQIIIQVAA
jgi:hypothetical protein